MAHAIWKGSVGFGLVNVPVNLYSAEARDELGFTMLDKRDHSPIGYKKVNKKTGEEVPKTEIVKGYEVSDGEFVELTDQDFKAAAPEKTQRVDIQSFIDSAELDPAYFTAPYFLEPAGRSDKVYALLREALKRTGKMAVGTVVLRAKERLAVVLPRGDALMLLLLRYPHELKSAEELKLPKKVKLSEAELKMAERLIGDLAAPWKPEQYKDEYREKLMAFIEKKAEGGGIKKVDLPKADKVEVPADIMALLKKSVSHAERRVVH